MIKSKIDNKKSRYKEIVEEKRNALKAITSNFLYVYHQWFRRE